MPAVRSLRRRASLCATLTFTVAATLHGQEGVTITMRTSMSGTSPMPAALSALTEPREVRILAAAGRSRIEYGGTHAMPPFPAGAIMLQSQGRTVVVDTARHEYFAYDQGAMLKEAAAMQQSAGTSMRVANPDVRVEHVGPGDALLGKPTDHWRITTRYEVLMSVAGSEMRMRSEMRNDSYYAELPDLPATRDLAALMPGAGPGTPAASPSPMATVLGPDLEARMRAAFDSLPKRLAVRSVHTVTMFNGDVPMMEMTTTTDITSVKRGPIAAASFEVPAGFREVPMPSIAAGAR